eukprot:1153782-Pelagomonas_calceolata.AAC.4
MGVKRYCSWSEAWLTILRIPISSLSGFFQSYSSEGPSEVISGQERDLGLSNPHILWWTRSVTSQLESLPQCTHSVLKLTSKSSVWIPSRNIVHAIARWLCFVDKCKEGNH